jgi:hypothetical protein
LSGKPTISGINRAEEHTHSERREARMKQRKRRKRARFILWGTIACSLLLIGIMGYTFLRIQADPINDMAYPPINNIPCDAAQNAYHIHIHLTIYINGKLMTIPKNIGIASDGSCFYWMHTHTSDGIIHIEAPQKQSNLALDDFLTIWHVGFEKLNFPLELTQPTGWRIFVNGQPFQGNVSAPLYTEVPLSSHDIVTLEYGTPDPNPDDASTYQFPPNLKE